MQKYHNTETFSLAVIEEFEGANEGENLTKHQIAMLAIKFKHALELDRKDAKFADYIKD